MGANMASYSNYSNLDHSNISKFYETVRQEVDDAAKDPSSKEAGKSMEWGLRKVIALGEFQMTHVETAKEAEEVQKFVNKQLETCRSVMENLEKSDTKLKKVKKFPELKAIERKAAYLAYKARVKTNVLKNREKSSLPVSSEKAEKPAKVKGIAGVQYLTSISENFADQKYNLIREDINLICSCNNQLLGGTKPVDSY